jgi:hypothetical protein
MISLFLVRMVFSISLRIRKYLSVSGIDMGIEKMVMEINILGKLLPKY